MMSFNDPLFSSEYFKKATTEETYLVVADEHGNMSQSIFDNPLLPNEGDLINDTTVKAFLNDENRGKKFIEFKDKLVKELADWAIANGIEVKENTFYIFNSYFNSSANLGNKIASLYKQGVPYLQAIVKAIDNDQIPISLRKTIVTNLLKYGLQVCEEGITDNLQTAFQELTTNVASRLMSIRRKVAEGIIKNYLYAYYPYFMTNPGMEIHIVKYFLKHFNEMLFLDLTEDHYAIDKSLTDNEQLKTNLRDLIKKGLCSSAIMNEIADLLDVDNVLINLGEQIKNQDHVGVEKIITQINDLLMLYGIDESLTRYNLIAYDDYVMVGVAPYAKQAILLSIQQRLINQGYFSSTHLKEVPLTETPGVGKEEVPDPFDDMSMLNQEDDFGFTETPSQVSTLTPLPERDQFKANEITFTDQFLTDAAPVVAVKNQSTVSIFNLYTLDGSVKNIFSHAYVYDAENRIRVPLLAYYYTEVIKENNVQLGKNILAILLSQVPHNTVITSRLFAAMAIFEDIYNRYSKLITLSTKQRMNHEAVLTAVFDCYTSNADTFVKGSHTLRAVLSFLAPLHPHVDVEEIMKEVDSRLISAGEKPFDFNNKASVTKADAAIVNIVLNEVGDHEADILRAISSNRLESMKMYCEYALNNLVQSSVLFHNNAFSDIKKICTIEQRMLKEDVTSAYCSIISKRLVSLCTVGVGAELTPEQMSVAKMKALQFFGTLKMISNYFGPQFLAKVIANIDPSTLLTFFGRGIDVYHVAQDLQAKFVSNYEVMFLYVFERMCPTVLNPSINVTLEKTIRHLYLNQASFPNLLKLLPGAGGYAYMSKYYGMFNTMSNNAEGIEYKKFLIKTLINQIYLTSQSLISDEFINFCTKLHPDVASELKLQSSNEELLRLYFQIVSKIKESTDDEEINKLFNYANIVLTPHHFSSVSALLDTPSYIRGIKANSLKLVSYDFVPAFMEVNRALKELNPEKQAVELAKQFLTESINVSLADSLTVILKVAQEFSRLFGFDITEMVLSKLLDSCSDIKNIKHLDDLLSLLKIVTPAQAIKWVNEHQEICHLLFYVTKYTKEFLDVLKGHARHANAEPWYLALEAEMTKPKPVVKPKKSKQESSKEEVESPISFYNESCRDNPTLFKKRKPGEDDDSENKRYKASTGKLL